MNKRSYGLPPRKAIISRNRKSSTVLILRGKKTKSALAGRRAGLSNRTGLSPCSGLEQASPPVPAHSLPDPILRSSSSPLCLLSYEAARPQGTVTGAWWRPGLEVRSWSKGASVGLSSRGKSLSCGNHEAAALIRSLPIAQSLLIPV
jgi:hypothetical protein